MEPAASLSSENLILAVPSSALLRSNTGSVSVASTLKTGAVLDTCLMCNCVSGTTPIPIEDVPGLTRIVLLTLIGLLLLLAPTNVNH